MLDLANSVDLMGKNLDYINILTIQRSKLFYNSIMNLVDLPIDLFLSLIDISELDKYIKRLANGNSLVEYLVELKKSIPAKVADMNLYNTDISEDLQSSISVKTQDCLNLLDIVIPINTITEKTLKEVNKSIERYYEKYLKIVSPSSSDLGNLKHAVDTLLKSKKIKIKK